MVLIIAMTWLIVSALTLLFIMGAHAASNPSYDAQLMVEPERLSLGGHEPAIPLEMGPKVELPRPVDRAS